MRDAVFALCSCVWCLSEGACPARVTTSTTLSPIDVAANYLSLAAMGVVNRTLDGLCPNDSLLDGSQAQSISGFLFHNPRDNKTYSYAGKKGRRPKTTSTMIPNLRSRNWSARMKELDEIIATVNDTTAESSEVGPRKYRTLELNGLPESDKEDLQCYVLTLSILIGADYTSILKLNRVNRTVAGKVGSARPVVLQFLTIRAKAKYLRQFQRQKSPINARQLAFNLAPIILTLTTHNTDDALQLYRSCQLYAERYGYSMVWLRDGNCFLQRSMKDKILVVRSQQDLDLHEAWEKHDSKQSSVS